jgi:hypothetical protein
VRAAQPQPATRWIALVPIITLACALTATNPARAADERPNEEPVNSASASEGADSPAATPRVTHAHFPPHARDPAADLAKRLDLDAKQQQQVRKLLAARQAQMRRVWSDPAVAPDDRVGAVKAINDRTIVQIRELLTEEQKAKYFQPRPAGSAAREPQPSVEDWINATKPRNPDASAPR